MCFFIIKILTYFYYIKTRDAPKSDFGRILNIRRAEYSYISGFKSFKTFNLKIIVHIILTQKQF